MTAHQRTVLFVCTGNVFRSMVAEHLFNSHAKKMAVPAQFIASSAGTTATPQPCHPAVIDFLRKAGADASSHRQRRLDHEMVAKADIIVCMTKAHLQRVEELGGRGVLFNALAFGIESDLKDDSETKVYLEGAQALEAFMAETARRIAQGIPALYHALEVGNGRNVFKPLRATTAYPSQRGGVLP